MKTKGFTLIELMIIVAIITMLATIILVVWAISAQNKASINSYKTSMQTLQTVAELCTGDGGRIINGAPGDSVCDTNNDGIGDSNEKYPNIKKCNTVAPYFVAFPQTGNLWQLSTATDASPSAPAWDCRGCRLICSAERCFEATAGTCK